jgi:hypothetical protein
MSAFEEMPLAHAQAKCEQLERELMRCPDFQLYLITGSHKNRARMRHVLMEIPNFRLWRTLSTSIERFRRRSVASASPLRALISGSHYHRQKTR